MYRFVLSCVVMMYAGYILAVWGADLRADWMAAVGGGIFGIFSGELAVLAWQGWARDW